MEQVIKTLETQRLILREFRESDAEKMLENWASSENVTKYLTWKPHESIDVTLEYIRFTRERCQNGGYDWIIVLKDTGEPIGSIGAVNIDKKLKLVHVGYCIGEKWWHQGYTSEAFKRVIVYFFDELGMNRVESRHDVNNPNSGKVMLKCGLKYEGTLRQSDFNNQGICDCAWYGILRSEYEREKNNGKI